jgi:glycerol uptake operon antiterminator
MATQDLKALPPIVASGFVCNQADVGAALRHGAVGVSTSDHVLWSLDPKQLRH